jgi:hypothetical protein
VSSEECEFELVPSPAQPDSNELPNPLEIKFGEGRIDVLQFKSDSDKGLILVDKGIKRPVGEYGNEPSEINHEPEVGEIYLSFANNESLNAVIEELQALLPAQPESKAGKTQFCVQCEATGKKLADSQAQVAKLTDLVNTAIGYFKPHQKYFQDLLRKELEALAGQGEVTPWISVEDGPPIIASDSDDYSQIVFLRNVNTEPEWDSYCTGYYDFSNHKWECEIKPTHYFIPPLPDSKGGVE